LLAKTIERIRWRLWHGQVQRALDLIGDTIEELERSPLGLTVASWERLRRVLQDLEIYVSGQLDSIINYWAAQRSAEPISTATTKSAVQRLLHRRMSAKQQMRWSPRGAHLMLKVRTTVMERDVRARSFSRRTLGETSVPPRSVITPRFETVSGPNDNAAGRPAPILLSCRQRGEARPIPNGGCRIIRSAWDHMAPMNPGDIEAIDAPLLELLAD